ncbi:hypothetical protein SDC9_115010 [bioreactor metagenome]|uniref:Uncharacterized protein n=1 Tax=bioreactor metagenome TaxID=1076179 RepID=A0A645BRM6_9ZZZZ
MSCPRITSTSFNTGTGLKKCMPITFSGRLVHAAISVMERDDELVARMVSGGQVSSNSRNTFFFNSMFSATASTTKPQSLKSLYDNVVVMRARICRLSFSLNFSFATNRDRLLSIFSTAFCSSSSDRSFMTTRYPPCANACAIPLPIVPVPIIPIFISVYLFSFKFRFLFL